MLKKSSRPSENVTLCANMILRGAKKRRRLAYAAVSSLNSKMGFAPNIMVVK